MHVACKLARRRGESILVLVWPNQ